MASDEKIEDLIREIAVKHGIAVSRDDPILILQTINARLMQESALSQQKILDRFKEELEAITHRWNENAKEKAERTLTAALDASRNLMAEAMQSSAQKATEITQGTFGDINEKLTALMRETRQIAYINIAAASIAAGAVTLALWRLL